MERSQINKIANAHKNLVKVEDRFWNHIQYCEKCGSATGKNAVEPKAHNDCSEGRALLVKWLAMDFELDMAVNTN